MVAGDATRPTQGNARTRAGEEESVAIGAWDRSLWKWMDPNCNVGLPTFVPRQYFFPNSDGCVALESGIRETLQRARAFEDNFIRYEISALSTRFGQNVIQLLITSYDLSIIAV